MDVVSWICVTIAVFAVVWAEPPIVDTQYGRLRGVEMRSKASPNRVMAFLGVPYAQPPVGDLRLALPQPVSRWEGVRDATQHCPACPQDEAVLRAGMSSVRYTESGMSEDCLFLDVFTPGLDGQRAVLVVIHGGGFVFGKNTVFISGVPLAAHEDIVVVSLNYRLGALGNLYNTEGAWPSNLGLRDQQFALRWVQDNIAAFGGDPNRVTLNGESAGSTSVSAQILAPSSRGLFQRAIGQSGSIFTSLRVTNPPQIFSDNFVASLDCPTDQPVATLECLRKKSLDDILEVQGLIDFLIWDQVWDGDFLPADSFKAYTEGNYSKVDLLSGVTSNEGFGMTQFFTPELHEPTPDPMIVKQQLTAGLERMFHDHSEDVDQLVDDVLGEDFEEKDIYWLRTRVMDVLSEHPEQGTTYLAAQLHSVHVANSYFYEFAQQPSFLADERPPWHYGCDHAMDLVFTFGLPFVEGLPFLAEGVEPMTDEELAFSQIVMRYFANFVKTGNPNNEGLPKWKPFSAGNENYQILQLNVQRGRDFKAEAMQFWGEKVRDLGKHDVQRIQRDEL